MILPSRPLASCLAALALALTPGAAGAHAADGGRAPQYVLISFDGAGPIAQWERSRALARTSGARFTYFLSCTFLLTPQTAARYAGPRQRAGRSNIGFAQSREEVAERLRQIWAARLEGHEIASHGCGHFDGAAWSGAEWAAELGAFETVLAEAWTLNDIPFEPAGWRRFADDEIVGFRAPYLATGPALFAALAEAGYRYDASTVSPGPAEPTAGDGLWRYALPMVPEGPQQRPLIAMDYNLYVRHSGAEERPDEAAAFEARAYRAMRQAFDAAYAGARPPLQLGFHFTLMNGGAYWRALERFAGEVCGMAEVRCVGHAAHLGLTRDAPQDDGALGG